MARLRPQPPTPPRGRRGGGSARLPALRRWRTALRRGRRGALAWSGREGTTVAVPTLYEWAGGAEALERLTERFYVKVRADPVLEPLFAAMPADHPHHVALWLGEVFRGPEAYSAEFGGYPRMMRQHLDRRIEPEQRRRWVTLLAET